MTFSAFRQHEAPDRLQNAEKVMERAGHV